MNTKSIVWINGVLVTMDLAQSGEGGLPEAYGLVRDKALITEDDHIKAIVAKDSPEIRSCGERIELGGALVTPGLIDCHTHLVFAGNRAREWEARLNGTSYTDIARAGGGIQYTVNATRNASAEELRISAENRLEAIKAEGITTVEIKSGYGLEKEAERKILEVIRSLASKGDMDIAPTLLAAHSLPAEYTGRSSSYMDLVCDEMIPEFWRDKLFEAADIFVESIAFNLEDAEKMYRVCAALGIPVKAHNEQMSNMGGSALLARYKGRSTDHIERLDAAGVRALAEAGTVAVLLPGAFYFLRDTQPPPVGLLRQYRVPMAVASDFNPGTSPFTSIRQAMNMAATFFGLTPAEVLAGVTRNAAKALGREQTHGILKPGYKANFAIWNVDAPVEIFYELGTNPLRYRVFEGRILR